MKVDVFSIGIPAALCPPWNYQFAPENGWLEDDRFLLGPGLFSVAKLQVGIYPSLDSFYATRLFPTELPSNDRILHTCMPVALRTQMRYPWTHSCLIDVSNVFVCVCVCFPHPFLGGFPRYYFTAFSGDSAGCWYSESKCIWSLSVLASNYQIKYQPKTNIFETYLNEYPHFKEYPFPNLHGLVQMFSALMS